MTPARHASAHTLRDMAVNERRIAVLGAGKIGEALICGLLSSGWRAPARHRRLEPPRRSASTELAERYGIVATLSNEEAVARRRARRDRGQAAGHRGPARRDRPLIATDQTVLSVAAAIPTATIERHLAPGRPGRARDAEHAVGRPRGSRRSLRRRPRRRRPRHARRGGARASRRGRPRAGEADGRRHRRLGLRPGLLRAPRRGDDRGRAPARALARDLDPARRPDDARNRAADARPEDASGRAARDGHLAWRHDDRRHPRARDRGRPRRVPERDPGRHGARPRARRRQRP